MEYAAGLIGMTLDCTELMRAGEVGDEEASATSAALSIMREIWGDGAFTARDVVKAMALPTNPFSAPTDWEEASKAKAEAIADALGELVGRRLDRPTAHSIGKLFQKRLVGRPAWIDDGLAIATLKKITGHNANAYRIHVSTPGEEFAAARSANADPSRKHSPHSPHSPRQNPGDREVGNEGNEGNEIPRSDVDSSSPKDKGATPGWTARL
jgi:hypothetical protein